MIRVHLADAQEDERTALRLLLQDLGLKIIGESAIWSELINQISVTSPDMILVDWTLIESTAGADLFAMRSVCSKSVVIVVISHFDIREQTVILKGADACISKGETSDRILEHLRAVAGEIIQSDPGV